MIAALQHPVSQEPQKPNLVSLSLEDFTAKMEREFIEGSGIDPALFRAATEIVSDTEVLPGHDVVYAIAEALNQHVVRFGHKARENCYAILFRNEDGTYWQGKLSNPIYDPKKGKYRKYETPKGNGSRAYLPPIPIEMRRAIGQRYGVEVPFFGSFWDWLALHPEIPIIFTEGGKKAMALMSLGYVAIALYGVNGGYRKMPDDTRALIPDLERFAVPERKIFQAFDQDSTSKTRLRVSIALFRFSKLLEERECEVSIVSWRSEQGKGVDDLIVNVGPQAWEDAFAQALPLIHWQLLERLKNRLTYPVSMKVDTNDMSTLDFSQIPETGIVGLDGNKGIGKTKAIKKMVSESPKAVAIAHRIALTKNLCERLKLDYRGDLDKVKGGDFISGAGYTLRVGTCVDSLLAIDPEKFAGCDLIIDEAVQVTKHLLTSSTCNKDGKRPALLSRVEDLIRVAKRVILADADLNNETLHYFLKIRDDDKPAFLIQNAHRLPGYAVQFVEAPDRTVIMSKVLDAVVSLESGKVLFISTDSKNTSEQLTHLIEQQSPDKRVLLVNSTTSGGELEQAFIRTPDTVLEQGDYDVVICSPSVATGVSIEVQGLISAVYGIYTGASCTDADIAQSLGRVREPVPRVIWTAKQGSNFSKVSKATNHVVFKDALKCKTSAVVRLIRSSLRADLAGWADRHDWDTDPHLGLFCRISADQNFSMYNLREAVRVRLRFEGHTLTVEQCSSSPAMKLLLRESGQALKEINAENLVSTEDLTYSEVKELEKKEGLSPDEALAVVKFHMKEFYQLEKLSTDDVLWDGDGRRVGQLLNLESLMYSGMALERTIKAIEKQSSWKKGFCPWDVTTIGMKQTIWLELELDKLVQRMIDGWEWTKYDLAEVAQKARKYANNIKLALRFTISDKVTDVQVIHQMLEQLCIKVTSRWSRSIPGHEKEKLRAYSIDADHWQRVKGILERRKAKRKEVLKAKGEDDPGGSPCRLILNNLVGDPDETEEQIPSQTPGSPCETNTSNLEGDPAEIAEYWLSEEVLADVKSLVEFEGIDDEHLEMVRSYYPEAVLRKIGIL